MHKGLEMTRLYRVRFPRWLVSRFKEDGVKGLLKFSKAEGAWVMQARSLKHDLGFWVIQELGVRDTMMLHCVIHLRSTLHYTV